MTKPKITRPPKYYRKPEYIVATSTGYYCAMKSWREAREFVRTRGPFLNPTIYRIDSKATRCKP